LIDDNETRLVTFRLNDAHFVARSLLDQHKPRFWLNQPEYRLARARE